tara:strand:+ start:225 stop:563 length:339 start_codon:yes stop_codon:yes gene_type:complete
MEKVSWNHFKKVKIVVGTILSVKDFPEAIKPAFKIKINMGDDIGIKSSSAQVTGLYSKDNLIGKQVLVVVNLPTKKIGPFNSECLVTGFYNSDGNVVLASPDEKIPNGTILE